MPTCSTAPGVNGLTVSPLPDDEQIAVLRHVRELHRLGEDLAVLDRQIAEGMDDPAVKRLFTITGVDLTAATGLMAAIQLSTG